MDLNTLLKITYGLYVVASKKEKSFNGQIANTVFQISSSPIIVAVSINKKNLTHEFIKESKVFTVSILSIETPLEFIGRFGFRTGREIDKFENVNFNIGSRGVPYLIDYTVGYLECEVERKIDVITHTLFLGRVTDAQTIADIEPMTYEYYRRVKGGKTQERAPTHIKVI